MKIPLTDRIQILMDNWDPTKMGISIDLRQRISEYYNNPYDLMNTDRVLILIYYSNDGRVTKLEMEFLLAVQKAIEKATGKKLTPYTHNLVSDHR